MPLSILEQSTKDQTGINPFEQSINSFFSSQLNLELYIFQKNQDMIKEKQKVAT